MSRQKLRLDQILVPADTPVGYGPRVLDGELTLAEAGGDLYAQQTWLTAADGHNRLTLAADPVAESLLITVNRQPLREGTDYTRTGTTVDFPTPLNDGDEVQDYYLTTTADPGPSILASITPGVTVDALPTPFYAAHRGGAWVAPENTLTAMTRAVADGVDVLEMDVRLTSDGQLVVIHDAIVDRVTSGTGTVTTMTAAAVQALTVDAGTWFGGGYGNLQIPTLAEVFDAFGGQIVMIIDAKDNVAAANQLIADIQSRGLQDSVIACSGTRTVSNTLAAAGLHTAHGVDDDSQVAGNTASSLLASGIEWVFVHGGGMVSDANISGYVSGGMKVVPWHVHRRYRKAELDALGVRGHLSDDPVYIGDPAGYRTTTDPFDANVFSHGHISNQMDVAEDVAPTKRGNVAGGKLVVPSQNDQNLFVLQGWAGPVADPTTYTLDVSLEWTALGNDPTRWAGISFAWVKDHDYADENSGGESALQAGYVLAFRTNGTLQLYRRTGGTATQVGSTVSTTALTVGAVATIRIQVTPTGITVTRTDVAAPNSIATSDTTHRGEYLFFGVNGINVSSTDVGPGVNFFDATIS